MPVDGRADEQGQEPQKEESEMVDHDVTSKKEVGRLSLMIPLVARAV